MTYETQRVITELDAARIRELGARLPDRGEGLSALNGLIDIVDQEAEIVPGDRVEIFPLVSRFRCDLLFAGWVESRL